MEEGWIEEFRALLDAAVARRLVADVPVGCFLSGGIDSSIVTALAMRHGGRERVKAFSIGFNEATFDETRYARLVAEHVGADHQVEILSVHRALDILPDLPHVWTSRSPTLDPANVSAVSACAASGHRRPRRRRRRRIAGRIRSVPCPALRTLVRKNGAEARASWPVVAVTRLPVSHRYMSLDFRLKRTLARHGSCRASAASGVDVAARTRRNWSNCSARRSISTKSTAKRSTPGTDARRPIRSSARSAFYIRLYLQDDILVKVDRASMLHSLEVRAPFLDNRTGRISAPPARADEIARRHQQMDSPPLRRGVAATRGAVTEQAGIRAYPSDAGFATVLCHCPSRVVCSIGRSGSRNCRNMRGSRPIIVPICGARICWQHRTSPLRWRHPPFQRWLRNEVNSCR